MIVFSSIVQLPLLSQTTKLHFKLLFKFQKIIKQFTQISIQWGSTLTSNVIEHCIAFNFVAPFVTACLIALVLAHFEVTTIWKIFVVLLNHQTFFFSDVAQFAIIHRVDQLVTEHLNAQGSLDPRGGLCCFWCPNKTWTSSLGTFDTLTIVENRLEMRK